jgi:H/ACA ribonucleoprotein complex subunit 4
MITMSNDYLDNIEWLLVNTQKILVKDEEEDIGFGYLPWERPPELYIRYGVVNLDKPPGPTSHQVTSWVKRILEVSKTGHGGTLDPMVTGVLPVGLERATLVMRYIVGSSKEYVGVIHLHCDIDDDMVESVFKLFVGRVYQKPPVRSSVRRKLRTRHIYRLDIIERMGRDILFRISCESGFYVRKLAHDIGLIIGCGAHLSELRRTRAGILDEHYRLVTLYDLVAAKYLWDEEGDFSMMRSVIIPMEYILKPFPKIIVKDSAVASVVYGAQLKAPGILALTSDIKKDERLVLLSKKGEAIAIAVSRYDADEIMDMDKGVVTITERVVMERDLYPPMWKSVKDTS